MNESTDRLVSVSELCSYWGVSKPHVYKLLHQGLPSFKIGNCRRFRLSEADAWLDAAREVA